MQKTHTSSCHATQNIMSPTLQADLAGKQRYLALGFSNVMIDGFDNVFSESMRKGLSVRWSHHKVKGHS
jgi:hypothetical protein